MRTEASEGGCTTRRSAGKSSARVGGVQKRGETFARFFSSLLPSLARPRVPLPHRRREDSTSSQLKQLPLNCKRPSTVL